MPGAKFEVTQVMEPEMLGGAAMIAMRQVSSRHDILSFEPAEGPEPAPAPAPAPAQTGAADCRRAQPNPAVSHRLAGWARACC